MSDDQDRGKIEQLPERRLDDEAGAKKAEDLKARFRVVSTKAGLPPGRHHTLGTLAPLIAFILTIIVVGYFVFSVGR